MASPPAPMALLNEQECWHLLSMNALGRLATVVAGQPEIFAVNYHAQRPTILLRTAEGTKLFSTVVNDRVAFEIDDHVVDRGWSVVASAGPGRRGIARRSREQSGSLLDRHP